MGKKGVKVWQEEVPDNNTWRKLVEENTAGEGLIICELFSEFFGYTEVLTPMIAEIMKGLGESADKLLWRRVNVIQLEEELRQQMLEEQKKAQQKESNEAGGDETTVEEDAEQPKKASAKATTVASVQCLEPFSGFHHPQPFFVFLRKGQMIEILREANPPLLEELVKKIMADPAYANANLSHDIMLKTDEELAAEKKEAAEKRAHMKLVQEVLEMVECEDPMKISKPEAVAIFEKFVTEDQFVAAVPVPERFDGDWRAFAESHEGADIDVLVKLFCPVPDAALKLILHPPTPTPEPTGLTPAERAERLTVLVGPAAMEADAAKAILKTLLSSEEDLAEDHEHVVAVVGKEPAEAVTYLAALEAITDEALDAAHKDALQIMSLDDKAAGNEAGNTAAAGPTAE